MDHIEHDLPELWRPDLPADERAKIERHLDGCPSCREAWRTFAALAPPEMRERPSIPEGYFATLPARIMKRRAQSERRPWTRVVTVSVRTLAPVVAGALVIVALVVTSQDPPTPNALMPVQVSEAVDYLSVEHLLPAEDLAPVAETWLNDRSLVLNAPQWTETGLEDMEPKTTEEVVEGLNETEIDRLITRLSERAM